MTASTLTADQLALESAFHEQSAEFHERQAKRHRDRIAQLEQQAADEGVGLIGRRRVGIPLQAILDNRVGECLAPAVGFERFPILSTAGGGE